MLFNSLEYAILLAVVFFGYFALARLRLLRLGLLLVASYVFYSWWSAYYLVLIVGSSTADYLVGRKLFAARTPRARKAWVVLSVTANLTLLGTFKYFNFFVGSLDAGLASLGLGGLGVHLNVVVPVGISFYTFESLSYIIDIYRGKLEPAQSPLEFLVFIAFFPHLVAGPIIRPYDFLPQLRPVPSLSLAAGGRGLFLICVGLVKKAVIADLLAVNLVDRVFELPSRYTSLELLAGVYGYAFQIYCDFSAYSDIAIGSALLLGLRLPVNFEHPYRAASLQDFWRRWHISLSSWLRDYLYISLGGSREGTLRTYRNLALTMLLGGLWHGASWTFVVWGALHGVGLAAGRALEDLRGARARRAPRALALQLLFVVLTFHYVCLGWVFFRAPTFERAWEVLRGIGALSGGAANVSAMLWAVLAAGLLTHLLPPSLLAALERALTRLPAPAQAAVVLAVVLGIRWAGTSAVVPFIYFQF
jgi:D-alanyl-lipoteichoic acid acyltransferase DltB (MBOAT superfamily)